MAAGKLRLQRALPGKRRQIIRALPIIMDHEDGRANDDGITDEAVEIGYLIERKVADDRREDDL